MALDEALRERLIAALRTVKDPEIPVDIWELGLVYGLSQDPDGTVRVTMTLTAPNCPVAGDILSEVEAKVAAVEGVERAVVKLVFEPPWDRSRMSEAANLFLGFEV
jgi:FeS assembly SUF system protein